MRRFALIAERARLLRFKLNRTWLRRSSLRCAAACRSVLFPLSMPRRYRLCCRAAMLQARSRRRQKLPCGHGLHSAPELSSMESILCCRCSGLLRIMQHPDFRESAGNDPVKKIKQERLVKLLFFIFLAAAGGIGLIFLYFHNPVATRWLPQCSFYRLTGLYCSGCGTTRALYAALHGDFYAAFRYNLLLFPSLNPDRRSALETAACPAGMGCLSCSDYPCALLDSAQHPGLPIPSAGSALKTVFPKIRWQNFSSRLY